MKVIDSQALYPREGVAWLRRRAAPGYRPYGAPWPALEPGEEIVVHDSQGWLWRARVETVDQTDPDDPRAEVRIGGEREALPLPDVVNGKIRLPNLSGHAHARRWARGDIVEIGGQYHKVKSAKPTADGIAIVYALEPSSAEAWARRPGRMSYQSSEQALEAVGSAVQTKTGEWLHGKKVTRTSFSGAAGRGHTYWLQGHHVTPERAAKLNDVHAPALAAALAGAKGERVADAMPADAVVLVPPRQGSLVPTGERVALVGDAVLHECHGDPDMLDSWYPYRRRVTDPQVVARVRRFVRKVRK